jgi:uncharacterized membrane protein YdjX (TVP38/TMEM64 family)
MSVSSTEQSHFPWKWTVVGVILIAAIAGWFLLPLGAWTKDLNEWIEHAGVWGAVIFAIVYTVATVLLLPASPLSIAAGLIFGLGWGVVLVAISATIGAAAAFLVARYLARHQVEKMVKQRPRFKAIDQAISEDGWKIVVLLRLSPLIPFNLQNYFYGLMNIRFWQYVPATFFGILPGVLLYVYIGATGKAVVGGAGGPVKWALLVAGLIATIIVTLIVTKRARARLHNISVEQEP